MIGLRGVIRRTLRAVVLSAAAFLGLFGGAGSASAQTQTAVEYYYSAWNFYFVTSFPAEIAALDGGAFGGAWQRTGQTFNVWSQATGGALPDCRFFSTGFSPRSSHFYTPYAAECAGLKAPSSGWQYEAIAFYVQLPDVNGNCPAGTTILYRLYNNGMGGAPNHRFTTSATTFNQMLAAGWILEGDGRTGASACVPSDPLINISVTKSNSTTIDFGGYGIAGQTNYYVRSGLLTDLNGDGKNEFVFSVTPYPQVPIPLTVIGDDNGALNLTRQYFPNGAPAVMNSSFLLYQDINGDGKKDIVAAEAGLDAPPWTGSKIGVARNDGGVFSNISNLVPDTTLRNYAVAVGDFNNTGRKQILLPAQDSPVVGASTLLQYQNGTFQVLPNPIQTWVPNGLQHQISMVVADFDGDGKDDLLIGGNWVARDNVIVYGGSGGLDIATLRELPPGPFGQAVYDWQRAGQPWPPTQVLSSTETISIAFDVNNDGRPDIFSLAQRVTYYPPGTITDTSIYHYDSLLKNGGMDFGDSAFWTYTNVDGRNFEQHVPAVSNLGRRYYFTILPYDINGDGNVDVLGYYWTVNYVGADRNFYGQLWGTTLFINDGQGHFTPVEADDVFPQLTLGPAELGVPYDPRREVGLIVPVSDNGSEFTGLQVLPWWDGEKRAPSQVFVQKFTSRSLRTQ